MHDMAILLHRKRYENVEGTYNKKELKHDVEQIQAMAGDIFHDKEGDEIN